LRLRLEYCLSNCLQDVREVKGEPASSQGPTFSTRLRLRESVICILTFSVNEATVRLTAAAYDCLEQKQPPLRLFLKLYDSEADTQQWVSQ
jgi:hypothetical protein